MLLSESHIINKTHRFYEEIDKLSFLSKNLYNQANYRVRQEFIETSRQKEAGVVDHATYINYYELNKQFISENQVDYRALPAKVANATLMQLEQNWKSFFKSIKDWKKNPEKYTGQPSLPRYKHKVNGRFILEYELGAIAKKELRKGIIKLSKTNIELPFINHGSDTIVKCVRIIPLKNKIYKIEIVYEKENKKLGLNKDNKLGIDIGVNNLMTLTSNKIDFQPIIINGRDIKSINQYYNKERARLQSCLEKNVYSSKKLEKLTHDRNMKINHKIHKATRMVVNYCIEHNLGEVIIGYNKGFKQEVNMTKANNQSFVNIPFKKMIDILSYKLNQIGVNLIIVEESYTSLSSFLNLDQLPKYGTKGANEVEFSGYREHRGSYKIKGKKLRINADVNGSYNVIRKALPNAFADGTEGYAVSPVLVNIFH